jgi:hypothetical protein
MGSPATQEDAQSRAERDHFDLAKREFDELHRLHVKFQSEIESEKRQIHGDEVERAQVDRRQQARRR